MFIKQSQSFLAIKKINQYQNVTFHHKLPFPKNINVHYINEESRIEILMAQKAYLILYETTYAALIGCQKFPVYICWEPAGTNCYYGTISERYVRNHWIEMAWESSVTTRAAIKTHCPFQRHHSCHVLHSGNQSNDITRAIQHTELVKTLIVCNMKYGIQIDDISLAIYCTHGTRLMTLCTLKHYREGWFYILDTVL